ASPASASAIAAAMNMSTLYLAKMLEHACQRSAYRGRPIASRAMPRIRTFIAVEMSPRVITRAGDLIDKLRVAPAEVNWVRTQQMHLTLKFLGDVPDTETPDICRVVNQVAAAFEPFEITCRGVGAFPNIRDPRTLWIGIEDGAEELKRLQAELDSALKT